MDQGNYSGNVAEFGHAVGQLIRRVRATNTANDLSLTQSAVMSRLDREGPATISDLARAEGMKPQSMGAVIATLEEMGIVERKPHPTDGRQVTVALTPKGAIVRKTTRDAKLAWLGHVISELSDEDRETLFSATPIIKRLVEL